MKKTLLLVEHDYQVKDFLDKGFKGEWIALGPSGMYYLEQKGIPYSIPEDYFSLYEIETICKEQFNKLKYACEEIDSILIERSDFLKEWEIKPFFFHLWQLAVLMDTLVSRVVWLKKIMEAFPTHKIYTHLSPIFISENSTTLFFDKHETLWGKLLNLQGWHNEIELLPDPYVIKHPKNLWSKFLNKIRFGIKNSFLMYNFYQFKRHNLKVAEFIRSILLKKRTHVLMLKNPYQWKYLFSDLLRSNIGLLFYQYSPKISYLKSDKKENTAELCDSFLKSIQLIKKVNYPSLIEDRIIWIIENAERIAKKIIKKLNKLSRKYNFSLILNSVTFDYSDYVVKQYFIKKKVPVLCYQHGSVWYDKIITNKADLHDMVATNILLTYGKAVTEAYSKSELNGHPEIISVGSIGLDKLSLKKEIKEYKKNKLKILYVITGYNQNAWYYGFSPPMSDRIYYKEQHTLINGLIKLIKNYSNIILTVKLHPSNYKKIGDDPPWVNKLLNKRNIFIKRTPGFIEIINDYDIIIIDSPTTTILEALCSNKFIFVLTSIISPPKKDLHILKKRCVCCHTAAELLDKLNTYIRSQIYPADVNNREFLKLYGTFYDDGKSKERVLEIINKLINLEIVYSETGQYIL